MNLIINFKLRKFFQETHQLNLKKILKNQISPLLKKKTINNTLVFKKVNKNNYNYKIVKINSLLNKEI